MSNDEILKLRAEVTMILRTTRKMEAQLDEILPCVRENTWWIDRKTHREICCLCHEVSRVGFWVPNDVWEASVHRHYITSVICLRCFTRQADERSVEWDKEIKFYPVSWIAHARDFL